jgi:hypothetical protein
MLHKFLGNNEKLVSSYNDQIQKNCGDQKKRFMKIALVIIRGLIISISSFAVQWLVYLTYVATKEPNTLVTIPQARFLLSIYNFVIPVAVLAILTRIWFPPDKSRLNGTVEGLVISVIYSSIIFVVNFIDSFLGWMANEEWGYGYFIWVPSPGFYPIISIIIIPCVVLCVQNLIERPLFNRWKISQNL